jgi:hypothetical protein
VTCEPRPHEFHADVLATHDNSGDEPAISIDVTPVNLRALVKQHHACQSSRSIAERLSPLWRIYTFKPYANGSVVA